MRNMPGASRNSSKAARGRADGTAVTKLLFGDTHLTDSLPQSFTELRRLLHRFISCRRKGYRVKARRICRETCMHLLGRPPHEWEEATFPCLLANMLRQLLIAHMRAQSLSSTPDSLRKTFDLLDLDAALTLLEARDPPCARVIELHYFGGLKLIDIACALLVEPAVVRYRLRLARAWLIARVVNR